MRDCFPSRRPEERAPDPADPRARGIRREEEYNRRRTVCRWMLLQHLRAPDSAFVPPQDDLVFCEELDTLLGGLQEVSARLDEASYCVPGVLERVKRTDAVVTELCKVNRRMGRKIVTGEGDDMAQLFAKMERDLAERKNGSA